MASAVYRRIFDDVFVMTSAQKPIRSSVFGLYFGENTSVVSLWGLLSAHCFLPSELGVNSQVTRYVGLRTIGSGFVLLSSISNFTITT